jgi:AcrR family transcriptional regulator
MSKIELTPDQRRNVILKAAVLHANAEGLISLTMRNVAALCEVKTSEHTVKHYFKTKAGLIEAVLDHPNLSQKRRSEYMEL